LEKTFTVITRSVTVNGPMIGTGDYFSNLDFQTPYNNVSIYVIFDPHRRKEVNIGCTTRFTGYGKVRYIPGTLPFQRVWDGQEYSPSLRYRNFRNSLFRQQSPESGRRFRQQKSGVRCIALKHYVCKASMLSSRS